MFKDGEGQSVLFNVALSEGRSVTGRTEEACGEEVKNYKPLTSSRLIDGLDFRCDVTESGRVFVVDVDEDHIAGKAVKLKFLSVLLEV